jgi:hypothetical protein
MRTSVELLQWLNDKKANQALIAQGAPPPISAPALTSAQAFAHLTPTASQQRTVVPDAERIRKLPHWDPADFKDLDLTDRFKTPGGTMRLHPLQSLALHWLTEKRGLLGMLATGAGKTIVSLLAPLALNAQRPLLLLPPTMQLPLRREMEKLKEHWKLPTNLFVVPYSQLSVATSTDLLDRLRPDLIIADECHNVANASASRSKRFIRYFKAFPETRLIALSGTLTGKSLKDYGHLAEIALRSGSPLPLNEADLMAWAACVDSESKINARNLPKESDWSTFANFCDLRHIAEHTHRREEARKVFSMRLRSTPGVVASKEGSIGCSLMFLTRDVGVPEDVAEHIKELHKSWTRPDGEELVSSLDLYRCAIEMSQGFYLRWVWPDGIVDHEWMNARQCWHREVRAVLNQNRVGMDSPLLITRMVMRVIEDRKNPLKNDRMLPPGINPFLVASWEAWDKVRHRPKPPTEVVWISKFLVEDAIKFRSKHKEAIIWYSSRAMAQALREAGERVIEAGQVPPSDGKAMACSIQSHGTGHNLQAWSENLVLSWPASGKIAEQLIARTHRFGQEADEIVFWLYEHTVDAKLAVKKSKEDADYIEQSLGASQKMNFGTWV